MTILLTILLLSIICRIYVGYFISDKPSLIKLREDELHAYLDQLDKLDLLQPNTNNQAVGIITAKKQVISPFDPNTIDSEEWQNLGFSSSQANSILKFRSRIGGFKNVAQLKACYVISEKKFYQIEPYIRISHVYSNPADQKEGITLDVNTEPDLSKVDLNHSGLEELVLIRGIGEHSARLLINYRHNLGGFVDVNQLYEIKGLDSSRVEIFRKESQFSPAVFRRVNLNTATALELKSHPYIDDQLAKLIVRYRELHGNYETVETLRKLALVDEQRYTRIFPYLKVQ